MTIDDMTPPLVLQIVDSMDSDPDAWRVHGGIGEDVVHVDSGLRLSRVDLAFCGWHIVEPYELRFAWWNQFMLKRAIKRLKVFKTEQHISKGTKMKHMALMLLLLLPVNANAQQTDAQRAKQLGLLPGVPLDEVAGHELDLKTRSNAALADRLGLTMVEDEETGEGYVCGHPDQADPDIAFGELDDISQALNKPLEDCEAIREMHRSLMQWRATGSGSFPHSCNPQYPGVHAIKMYVDVNSFNSVSKRRLTESELSGIVRAGVWGPSGDPAGRPFTLSEVRETWGDKPMWQVMVDFTAETYRRWGLLVEFEPLHENHHNWHVRSRIISTSTIGIGWFPNSSPCPGDHVEFHIDSSYTAGFNSQLGLWVHEAGHTAQLPHQFNGQDRHQEPMSYRYSRHLVVGYSDGSDAFSIPRAPSIGLLTRLYGGEPVGKPWGGMFEDEPDPPTPPTGDAIWEIGDEVQLTSDGRVYTMEVIAVDSDDTGLAAKVAKAASEVDDYDDKEKHQQTLGTLYLSMAVAVEAGSSTVEQAHQAMALLTPFILGADATKWTEVIDLAKTATTADGLRSVARGLGIELMLSPDYTGADMLAIVLRLQQAAQPFEIDPLILAVIKIVVELVPEGPLRTILELVITVLEQMPVEDPVSTKPPVINNDRRLFRSELAAL